MEFILDNKISAEQELIHDHVSFGYSSLNTYPFKKWHHQNNQS